MPAPDSNLRRPLLSSGHPILLALGVVIGASAGLELGSLTQSWWLGGLSFLISVYLADRVVPEIAGEGRRRPRLVYLLSLPVTAAVMTFLLWTLLPDWLVVPVAAGCGWIIRSAVGIYAYPDVARQEEAHPWDKAAT